MMLQKLANITFVSSKVSDGNMDPSQGNPKQTLANRKNFFQKLGIKLEVVVEVRQVHGKKIIIVEKAREDIQSADGLITNNKNVYLMIKMADCIPIGFYDSKHKAAGLIHVGFRGLDKSIIQNTIISLQKHFGTKSEDLVVKFGPSIGPCCYRMDLWTEAKDQLIACGVFEKNIHNPRICTYESKKYFSHRRAIDQGLPDSRFVTILGLQNAN